jgi:radical SAM-linked protein
LICRYRKGEEVRWLSHLDVKRTLERAMRRAQLPVALTQGHNPHPKLSLGPPLPLGATGEAELLAIHLEAAMEPTELKERLNAQLPPGLEVLEAWAVPGYRKKETFGEVDVAEYQVTVQGGPEAEVVRSRVRALLSREEIPVQRGGERPERRVDLRPLILGLEVTGEEEGAVEVRMRLRTGSHGGARPQEILELLGLGGEECAARYQRTAVYAGQRGRTRPAAGLGRRWARARRGTERS